MVEKVNFDDYAKNYDEILKEQLNFFSEDDKYFAKYKVDLVKKNVSNNPKRILEYGCGTGRNIAYFREHFPDAEIFGVDLSAESIEIASRENPSARFFVLDDIFLNTNASFDLIFVAGVFHHIAPGLRGEAMANINQLLAIKGEVLVFEHNPINPVTRKLVRECPFDSDAVLLPMNELLGLLASRLSIVSSKYTLFFPPALKLLLPIERMLSWFPLGGQYFIHAKKTS